MPITYFIEKPFQNWTRISSQILGSVFLYVDYTVEVDAVRAELERAVSGNSLWDKRVANVQVIDAKSNTVELRVLVSASNASNAWDWRCQLRERPIDFIRAKYPSALPTCPCRGVDLERVCPPPEPGRCGAGRFRAVLLA